MDGEWFGWGMKYYIFLSTFLFLIGCASSINDSQFTSFTDSEFTPKAKEFSVPIIDDKSSIDGYEVIGLATAKAYLLEVAIKDLKKESRQAGADALIDFKYEQKMSVDYLQDLFFVEAKAIIYK